MRRLFISSVRQILRRSAVAARSVTVYPDDVFITSYPKSGNTWVRFLIANLLWSDGSTDFTNIDQRIPDIYAMSDLGLSRCPQPRYLKSHEYFDPRYPKVIYLVRDVRSVFLSYYYHRIRLGRIPYEFNQFEFAQHFLKGDLDPYGSWRENVTSWLKVQGRESQRFCLIYYEDMIADSMKGLKRIVGFLKLDYSSVQLKNAVELSSFDRLRKLEKTDGHNWQGGRKVIRKEIPFLRSGKTDEWKEVLDTKTLTIIKESNQELLEELEYEI